MFKSYWFKANYTSIYSIYYIFYYYCIHRRNKINLEYQLMNLNTLNTEQTVKHYILWNNICY